MQGSLQLLSGALPCLGGGQAFPQLLRLDTDVIDLLLVFGRGPVSLGPSKSEI